MADGSEYRGRYEISRDQLYDFHKRKLEILTKVKVDLFAFETIPCQIEAGTFPLYFEYQRLSWGSAKNLDYKDGLVSACHL